MKHLIATTAAASVLAFAVSAGAQTPATTDQQQTTTQSSTQTQTQTQTKMQAEGSSTTLTGCLQTAPGDASTYVLNILPAEGAAASASTATAGTTGTTSSSTTMKMDAAKHYRVTAPAEINLKPHVGHKVEIVGSVAATSGSTGSATASTTQSTQAGTETKTQSSTASMDLKAAPQLTVKSIKHVAASCP